MLITPDQSADILEGITRDSILKLADELSIGYTQRAVDRSELYIADELFLCGSSARITPILSVDRRPIGDGKIGPLTKRLVATYDEAQHNHLPAFSNWLTRVALR